MQPTDCRALLTGASGGIGLALARRLVELQSGQIGVVSEPGEGATVELLPDQGVLRLAFEFEPGNAALADLQAVLTTPDGVAQSETWLARWTA